MIRDVVQVSPIALPEGSELARTPPRPPEFRMPDYEQKFDYRSLIYDVFHYHGDIAAIGPPLLNLKEPARSFAYCAHGRPLRAYFSDMNRMSRWVFKDASKLYLPRWIRGRRPLTRRSPADLLRLMKARDRHQPQPFPGGTLTISFGKEEGASAPIGANMRHLFANRRCLLTKSKNNDLRWIRDWVKFHVKAHRADAALIYDNGSDRYAPREILDALAGIAGLEAAVVVEWPFKWGVHGDDFGIWDSDFAQHGILEHARWRFLEFARGVVYQDVDELALSDRSIFEIAEQSKTGTVLYEGRWIEHVTPERSAPAAARPRHADFRYFRPDVAPASTKWCTVPSRNKRSRQWRVHWIKPAEKTKEIKLRHFRAISTGWKHDRSAEPFDASVYREDTELVRALAEAELRGSSADKPSSGQRPAN